MSDMSERRRAKQEFAETVRLLESMHLTRSAAMRLLRRIATTPDVVALAEAASGGRESRWHRHWWRAVEGLRTIDKDDHFTVVELRKLAMFQFSLGGRRTGEGATRAQSMAMYATYGFARNLEAVQRADAPVIMTGLKTALCTRNRHLWMGHDDVGGVIKSKAGALMESLLAVVEDPETVPPDLFGRGWNLAEMAEIARVLHRDAGELTAKLLKAIGADDARGVIDIGGQHTFVGISRLREMSNEVPDLF
jgi:hypothetical protein